MSLWEKTNPADIAVWFLDLSLLAFLIYDFGFEHSNGFQEYQHIILPGLLLALIAFNVYGFFKYKNDKFVHRTSKVNLVILLFLVLLETVVLVINYETSWSTTFLKTRNILEYGLLFYFMIRLMFLLRKIYSIYFNPAILFVGSFAIIALVGTFLLMLPSATTRDITFTDALFTATSATVVTGLSVLDTATDFTSFGQT